MIYPQFSLRLVEAIAGFLLIAAHGIALLKAETVRSWLKAFPRSHGAGVTLLAIDTLWAFVMVMKMDLGEFSRMRTAFLVIIPIAAALTYRFVDEFLAVRTLGILLLLVVEPLLESAFLHPEMSRLFLVALAYVWAVVGMFWVGKPYLLRDQIAWAQKTGGRWRAATLGGIGYGLLLLVCAVI